MKSSKPFPAENLRKSNRISYQIPVRMMRQPESSRTKSFHISSMTQISRDGAFLNTSASYPEGSMIDLEFELPTQQNPRGKPIHALGQVTWVATSKSLPMGLGVRFVMMTQEEKRILQQFVHQALRRKRNSGQRSASTND